MTSTDKGIEPAAATAAPVAPPASATGVAWGNSGPICLGGFATTTFMLSMVNANLVPAVLTTTVLAVALMFGGLAQLIGGILQLRIGNTFGGALFTGFGAFWPRPQRLVRATMSQSSSSLARSSALASRLTILSSRRCICTVPVRHGTHLPHDSSMQNSMKKRAISGMRVDSSMTIIPPEPMMEPRRVSDS